MGSTVGLRSEVCPALPSCSCMLGRAGLSKLSEDRARDDLAAESIWL